MVGSIAAGAVGVHTSSAAEAAAAATGVAHGHQLAVVCRSVMCVGPDAMLAAEVCWMAVAQKVQQTQAHYQQLQQQAPQMAAGTWVVV